MAAGQSSSLADRVGRQYERETGREARPDDPQYVEYIKTALPAIVAADRAKLERSQHRWKVADKVATVAVGTVLGAGALSALAAPAAAGAGTATGAGTAGASTAPAWGIGAANTGAWTASAGAAPALVGASVPGVVGGTAVTAASQGAAYGVPTVVGAPLASTSLAGTGLAASPTAASIGGGQTAATTAGAGGSSVLGKIGSNMTGSNWVDVGSTAVDFLSNWKASNVASAASDRAADLQYKTSQELMALEREKETRRQYEWGVAEAARKRNAEIDEENRLEDLRQLEQKDAQAEPRRVAKENAYRAYMKHYWGIDVAPTVARTARQIQAGSAGTGKQVVTTPAPTNGKLAVSTAPTYTPAPLAAAIAPAQRTAQFTGPTTLVPNTVTLPDDQSMALRRSYDPNEEMR